MRAMQCAIVIFVIIATSACDKSLREDSCDFIINGSERIGREEFSYINNMKIREKLNLKVAECGGAAKYKYRLENLYFSRIGIDDNEGHYMLYYLGQTTDVRKIIVFDNHDNVVRSGFLE